jgi:transposase
MWTDANRPKYSRDHLRYSSDLNDDEWAVIEPRIPPAKRGGDNRGVDMREGMNGQSKLCEQRPRRVMSVPSTGWQWRLYPESELSDAAIF